MRKWLYKMENCCHGRDMFRFIPSRGEDDDSVTYKGEAINCIFQFEFDAYLKLHLTPNQFCPSYLNAHL